MSGVIDVPLGPALVEYGKDTPEIFDITKGGIVFRVNTTKKDITIDQMGDTPVKSVLKGRTCQATVPFALHDLKKLASVTPNSKYVEDNTDPANIRKRLNVYAQAGYNLLKDAKQMIIKPTSEGTSPNDYVTIPMAGAMADVEWTYDSDNERICNITFVGYPDTAGLLYFLGDEAVVIPE